MASTADLDRLVELRRELHQYPEPAWREFYTTARLVEELERIGADELLLGPEAIDPDYRWGVPEEEGEIERWAERALADGADADIVERLAGGQTGLIGVLDRGEGPHVALRVDIDALFRQESDEPEHAPAAEGYRSTREEAMHACGHDAHATIGVGVFEALANSDFEGRFSVIFQPAEEEAGGGRAIVEGGHLDDVDYLLAVHVGLDHETGEVVAGIDDFLAVTNISATFAGEAAHAGAHPELGRNAVQALATAVENLYGIARHNDGITRVNVGRIEGGSASNIVPEGAMLAGEVRGGTTPLRDYMRDRAVTVLESAAEMHDCDVELDLGPEVPSAQSDEALVTRVQEIAGGTTGVTTVKKRDRLGGSEDATFLMRHVQERGGHACYVGIGSDHPGGHHTATFDVDEESIPIGVDVLSDTILDVFADPP